MSIGVGPPTPIGGLTLLLYRVVEGAILDADSHRRERKTDLRESFSPSSGRTAGGTSVTITGTNLAGATEVTFGGTEAANVALQNATTITAAVPAGSRPAPLRPQDRPRSQPYRTVRWEGIAIGSGDGQAVARL